MIKNLIANYKTTSMGVGTIVTGLIHLYFAYKTKGLDESTLTTTALAILGGVGLIVAGDASAPTPPPPVSVPPSPTKTTNLP